MSCSNKIVQFFQLRQDFLSFIMREFKIESTNLSVGIWILYQVE